MRYIILRLHVPGRIDVTYLPTIPRIKVTQMPLAGPIVHLNGVM